jgi:hypothetical protein
LIRNGEEKSFATTNCRTAANNTLSPSPWGMRSKKPTISQKSGGKNKLPPPHQDPMQRHQKYRAATSPPLESACASLICRHNESVARDLSFTIDIDVWRVAPSCYPTRWGGERREWQHLAHAVPHCHKPPIQICSTGERERRRLGVPEHDQCRTAYHFAMHRRAPHLHLHPGGHRWETKR